MLVRFSCKSQHAPINLQWKQQNLHVKEQPRVQEPEAALACSARENLRISLIPPSQNSLTTVAKSNPIFPPV